MNIDTPSLIRFREFVELKDFKPPTRKEYVRYVRRLADHFQCDPATRVCDTQPTTASAVAINKQHGRTWRIEAA